MKKIVKRTGNAKKETNPIVAPKKVIKKVTKKVEVPAVTKKVKKVKITAEVRQVKTLKRIFGRMTSIDAKKKATLKERCEVLSIEKIEKLLVDAFSPIKK